VLDDEKMAHVKIWLVKKYHVTHVIIGLMVL